MRIDERRNKKLTNRQQHSPAKQQYPSWQIFLLIQTAEVPFDARYEKSPELVKPVGPDQRDKENTHYSPYLHHDEYDMFANVAIHEVYL